MRLALVEGEPRTAEDMAATLEGFLKQAPPREVEKFSAFLVGFTTHLTEATKETEK